MRKAGLDRSVHALQSASSHPNEVPPTRSSQSLDRVPTMTDDPQPGTLNSGIHFSDPFGASPTGPA
jgi:hypothetical protein